MNLQELLGDELYKQVKDKLGDNKIGIINNGEWIPKNKFDSINENLKELKGQIQERDDQLQELTKKAEGNDTLLKQIQELKDKNEKTVTEYEAKIKQRDFDYTLNTTLEKAKIKNLKAFKALLDLESIKVTEKGELEGLENQLKALKESDPYMFDTTEGIKGRIPNGGGKSGLGINPFSKEHFNLTEQGKLFKENPELAKQLKAQAK